MRLWVCLGLVAALGSIGARAAAQDAGTSVNPNPPTAPDKSGYTLFDPTPTSALRTFSTDRPAKSNSPVTVDAGHFQYETDLFNYTHSNAGGSTTRTTSRSTPCSRSA